VRHEIADCRFQTADFNLKSNLQSAICNLQSAISGMRMKLTDVIRRPLITEKTSILREDGRTIVFQVAKDANKVEIKRAIEQLLGAKVDSIRTSIAHGKIKRQGRFAGRRSDWKKAYVKLREGAKMPEFLEGA
jgi:large subunit ribosomal protein L23